MSINTCFWVLVQPSLFNVGFPSKRPKGCFLVPDVTGSSDGSVRVWEWGVGQPVYTARVAGQHAKVR